MSEKADYKKSEREAKKLIEKYGFKKPFIDVFLICDNENISIRHVEFKAEFKNKISGFFDFKKNEIIVNVNDSYKRRSFTIAHELGHFILHQNYIQSSEYQVLLRQPSYTQKPPVEQEADCFAAELLVPFDMLNQYRGIASNTKLSDLFLVSEEVISNRLNALNRLSHGR